MRTINYIAIHCTATKPETPIDAILNYWKNILKWKSPGYHYIIEADGRVTQLLSIENISNGVQGYNSITINIAYVGGIGEDGRSKDTRTTSQMLSMLKLVKELKITYPNAIVQGHRDFPNVKKDCPCFDAKSWFKANIP